MRKRKDGKVVASLTEVKNKTGDIFALVDQYGEVILTSYNKEKYKIVKKDISDILEQEAQSFEEEHPDKVAKEDTKKEDAEEINELEEKAVVPVVDPTEKKTDVKEEVVEKKEEEKAEEVVEEKGEEPVVVAEVPEVKPAVEVDVKTVTEPKVVVPANITEPEVKAESKEVAEEKTETPAKEEVVAPSAEDDMTDIIPWNEGSEMEQMHVQEITAALQ